MEFEKAVEIVLKHEGGYVQDPRDAGGETKFGISKRMYPHLDIRNLTKEQAVEIYRQDYWEKPKINLLPSSLRLMAFDCAVNQGASVAIGLIQAAVGAQVDGILGPKTLQKLGEFDPKSIVKKIATHRMNRYFMTKGFNHFGAGWIKRLLEISIETAEV